MSGLMPGPIGVIGLGAIGGPVAHRLRAAGLPVVVHARDRAKAGALLAAGATWADSPRALGEATGGSAVLVALPDYPVLRSVLLGRKGLARGASPGTIVVNLSTIAPEESRTLADGLSGRGLRYLETPVGGSRDAAEKGELLLYVGGEPADLEAVRPVLERISRRIERVGPVGSGSAMKLVNNLVTLGTVALDAEAIALAEALGLDRVRAIELLLAGGAESRMLAGKREAFARREYPVQFRLALAAKDLRLIGRAAREAGLPAPLAREVRRRLEAAQKAGFADQDLASVLETARSKPGEAKASGAETTACSGSAPVP